MNSRTIQYHFRRSWNTPLNWGMQKLLSSTDDPLPQYRGVVIADFRTTKNNLFVTKTKEALDFLAETDPRRFRRVQRFIKTIMFSNRGLARYDHHILKGCWVGFDHFHFEDDAPCKVPWYATTLVHEATHGLFYAHRIPYSKKTRERIELCCVKEEWRFAQRFPQDNFDWEAHIWSKISNRAWDSVWHENPIHRLRTVLWPNAHGELERKETEVQQKVGENASRPTP